MLRVHGAPLRQPSVPQDDKSKETKKQEDKTTHVMKVRAYYVYIITNPIRTVLYTGMTNDLVRRLAEHEQARGKTKSFVRKYFCYQLVYW